MYMHSSHYPPLICSELNLNTCTSTLERLCVQYPNYKASQLRLIELLCPSALPLCTSSRLLLLQNTLSTPLLTNVSPHLFTPSPIFFTLSSPSLQSPPFRSKTLEFVCSSACCWLQEWLQQQGVTSGTADGASTADKAPTVSTIGMTVLVRLTICVWISVPHCLSHYQCLTISVSLSVSHYLCLTICVLSLLLTLCVPLLWP